MPTTESSMPFGSLGRTFLSLRRDQPHPSGDDETPHSSSSSSSSWSHQDQDLEAFQRHVADLFSDLAASDVEILSIRWIRQLLDSFLICLEDFRQLVLQNRKPPPLDRLVADFFDRAVKALDVCNAVRDGIGQIRRSAEHLEIILTALGGRRASPPGEGQLRRAKKALALFSIPTLDGGCRSGNPNYSSATQAQGAHRRSTSSSSSAWSVSRSWSAARQLQAIAGNIAPPRNCEIAATAGLAVPVYTMNCVLLFVAWALVAAIPCQDRGIQIHFSVPRTTYLWAPPFLSLHDRIVDDSKKKERINSSANGLLKEIHHIDKCVRALTHFTDDDLVQPAADLNAIVNDLALVSHVLKDGLDPLEQQLREVFRRLVRSRTEGLHHITHTPPPHP